MTKIIMEKNGEAPADMNTVQIIEAKYNCILPEQVKKLLSYDMAERFAEEYRILSNKEILEADNNLGIDFPSKRIIPFIDTFDNNFIAFDIKNNSWIKINIVDEIIFDKANSLNDLI